MQVRFFPVVVGVVILFSIPSFAQTPERLQARSTLQAQDQNLSPNSMDTVAKEIALLRQQLQTLNTRLREISERVLAPDATKGSSPVDRQNRISLNLDLLTRAEQRAELLRKQLLELIEKETSLRTRLVQIEEDMRPESMDRATSLVGSTRTPEIRDVRRRVLENERRGNESLLRQVSESRSRLDDDVKQADALVSRLRQRVLPLIEKEIEKINPN